MIVNAKSERLQGFTVFDNATGRPSGDIYAMTEYGKLMRKNGEKWDQVPQRGEYVVQYGGGYLEVY